MNILELEHNFRNSNELYSLKATYIIHQVSQKPCPDCSYKNESPPVSTFKKDEKCFEKCNFEIMIWILSQDQLKTYEKVRSLEKKQKDLELAKNVGKIVQAEATLTRV